VGVEGAEGLSRSRRMRPVCSFCALLLVRLIRGTVDEGLSCVTPFVA